MKYSLSDIIKDLLAKIPVLENRINTLSTKITNINNNGVKKVSNSAPEGNTLTLAEGKIGTDAFRIIVDDEGKDNLYVSFDTCDNGNEKIQFRQYGAAIYPFGIFNGTPIRTAVILGRNGETTFPVSVTAPKFVGNLQGNADSANTATSASVLKNSGNQTAITGATAGGLRLYKVYNNGYPTPYGNVLSIGGDGDGQILAGWSAENNGIERLYYRNRRDNCMTWSAWKTVAYYDDINALAPTKTGGGASGTWNINITGNSASAAHANNADVATKVNATAPNGGAVDLVFGTMTNNDYARIRVGGSDDNGWLEIATADNNHEPIYVRQYSGSYD